MKMFGKENEMENKSWIPDMIQNKEELGSSASGIEGIYPGVEIESIEELERLLEAMKKSYERETGKDFEEWLKNL